MSTNDREMRECPQCGEIRPILKRSTYCSRSCAKKGKPRPDMVGNAYRRPSLQGELNHLWKGEEASYRAKHNRLYRARGKASAHDCACGRPAQHWANLTGDYDDIYDFEPMCALCHRRYDNDRRAEPWTKIAS